MNQLDAIKRVFVPIHKEGIIFILPALVITIIFYYISSLLFNICLIVLAIIIYFFRNPPRTTTDIPEAIVSPADGLVDSITELPPPDELNLDSFQTWVRISTFLSLFDVHSQRVPFDGVVTNTVYKPGLKLNVSLDKNSKDNERHSVVLKCADNNEEIAFVQIAGLVARRIVCNLKQGDKVKKGNLYGLIKFGSRVDLYLPKDKVNIVVKEGQSMIGGETIMAYFKK